MYICVDFDGTIVDHAFPYIGGPVPGAIEWMKLLANRGGRLILHTVRSDGQEAGDVLQEAVTYLENEGIELFGVNENPDQKVFSTSPKTYGHFYIDDAALGCPLIKLPFFLNPCVDWDVIGPMAFFRLTGERYKGELELAEVQDDNS